MEDSMSEKYPELGQDHLEFVKSAQNGTLCTSDHLFFNRIIKPGWLIFWEKNYVSWIRAFKAIHSVSLKAILYVGINHLNL